MSTVEFSGNVRFMENPSPDDHGWGAVNKVRYVEQPTPIQVQWGSNSDPQDAGLEVGNVYELERVSIHSWHTKVFLRGVDCGRGFNSVSFEAVNE